MEATKESTAPQDDLDAIWHQFEESEPILTQSELDDLNRRLFATDGVRTVKASLLMLTRTGRELLEDMHGGSTMAPAFKELAECAKDRAALFRGVAAALDTAEARLRLALCDADDCRRRSKSDPPRRSNIDPGMDADRVRVGCGQV